MAANNNKLSISLIFPVSKIVSGYGIYSNRLITGLSQIPNLTIEKIPIKKKETTFMGRPILGTASQIFSSKMKRPRGRIVHSLAPTVINRRTNVVTLHDVVPLQMKEEFADTLYRRKGHDMIFKAALKVQNIIVDTEVGKQDLLKQFEIDPERVHVVSLSIDHSIFYNDPDEKLKVGNRKLIVTVGDMNPRKRFDILFRAAGGQEDLSVVHIGPVNSWAERNEKNA